MLADLDDKLTTLFLTQVTPHTFFHTVTLSMVGRISPYYKNNPYSYLDLSDLCSDDDELCIFILSGLLGDIRSLCDYSKKGNVKLTKENTIGSVVHTSNPISEY